MVKKIVLIELSIMFSYTYIYIFFTVSILLFVD